MQNGTKIILAFALIVVSNFIGNIAPPSSVVLTPIIIIAVSYLVLKTTYKPWNKALLIATAIIINDFIIKLFSGGTYDLQGAGFVNLFLVFGLAIVTIITFIEFKFTNRLKIFNSICMALIIPAVVGLHLYYFGLFGLSYSEPPSDTIALSKEKGAFLSNLQFSETAITYENDSIYFVQGWSEKEMRIDHKQLIRKRKYTNQVNYILKTTHNLEKYAPTIYYKVNSKDINGASPVDSTIKINVPDSDSIVFLTLFKLRGSVKNDTIIKQIRITNN